jgi:hypothetical protein
LNDGRQSTARAGERQIAEDGAERLATATALPRELNALIADYATSKGTDWQLR